MRSKGVGTQSRFLSYMLCPFRLLAQSLTGGGHVSYGNAMGCPMPHIQTPPRSFSATSALRTADDLLWDLIRLPSHTGRTGPEAELRRTRSSMPLGGGGGVAAVPVPRSKTVAYGRIDEEREFELGDEDRIGLLGKLVYPRTTSCSLSTKMGNHY